MDQNGAIESFIQIVIIIIIIIIIIIKDKN